MSSPRLFNGQSVGQIGTSFGMLFDPNQASTDGATTGMWRALHPSDFAASLNISGGISATVDDIAVTGGQISLIGTSSVLVTNSVVPISGQVNTYNAQELALLSGISGALNGNLTVTTWTASTGTASAATLSGVATANFGVALPNNPNRRAWYIQNLSTGVLLVNFSATIPTTGSFNVLLKGGTNSMDGIGASWSDSPAIYTGPVAVSGLASVCPYICWQL